MPPFFHRTTQTTIAEGSPFILDGVQYPANWLNLSTPEDKAEHGIVEITEGPKPDFDPAKQELYQGPLDPATATTTWLVRDFSESELANRANQKRAITKAQLSSLTVTTKSGRVFDGNELAQSRISRKLQAMQLTGELSTTWVLHDNTQAEVTMTELGEVLVLATTEQARLWTA